MSELVVPIVLALLGLGVAVAAWAVLMPPTVRLQKEIRRRGLLEERIARAGLEITPDEFVRSGAGVGLAVGAVVAAVTRQVAFLIIGPVVGLMVYWMLLLDRKEKFVRMYRDALATAVDIVNGTFAATPSVMMAMKNIAEYGPPVLRDDFAYVYAQMQAGATFETAMAPIQEKRRDVFLDQLVEALSTREQQGGSVRGLLAELSTAIRGQQRIFRMTMAQQRQARLSAVIVSLSPIAFFLLMNFSMPEFAQFYRTLMGQMVLMVVLAMTLAGYYLQNRIGSAGMDIDSVIRR